MNAPAMIAKLALPPGGCRGHRWKHALIARKCLRHRWFC
jgi:hypothetical protein